MFSPNYLVSLFVKPKKTWRIDFAVPSNLTLKCLQDNENNTIKKRTLKYHDSNTKLKVLHFFFDDTASKQYVIKA